MKNKWFFTSIVYFILSGVLLLMYIALVAFLICMCFMWFQPVLIVILISFIILFVIGFRLLIYNSMTVVIINKEGISLHGIFGRIKSIKWTEIDYIGFGWGKGIIPEFVFYIVETSFEDKTLFGRSKYFSHKIRGYNFNIYGAGQLKHQYTCNTKKGILIFRSTKKILNTIREYYIADIKDYYQYEEQQKTDNSK